MAEGGTARPFLPTMFCSGPGLDLLWTARCSEGTVEVEDGDKYKKEEKKKKQQIRSTVYNRSAR